MADVDTNKIPAVRVTGDRTWNSSILAPLLEDTWEVLTRTGQV